jgi:hypothetical protein
MADEVFEFGAQVRRFLNGFVAEELEAEATLGRPMVTPALEPAREAWGRVVDPTGLPKLFRGDGAPKKHVRGQHPPAGIDHMGLKSVDVFRIPGMGEFTVPFEGYFQVVRSEPDTTDWETATVYVNFTELHLFGHDPTLGDITVDLNPSIVSGGNTFPARDVAGQGIGKVACRINVAARFHVAELGLTLFNKTPIQLVNDDVKGIPTIGEGGQGNVNSLPMYRWTDPQGELFGYLEELEYKVQNYATASDVAIARSATSLADYQQRVRSSGNN